MLQGPDIFGFLGWVSNRRVKVEVADPEDLDDILKS
jgi:hypothetical protein